MSWFGSSKRNSPGQDTEGMAQTCRRKLPVARGHGSRPPNPGQLPQRCGELAIGQRPERSPSGEPRRKAEALPSVSASQACEDNQPVSYTHLRAHETSAHL
eukprot:8251524-Alexandrium_andersonii.AAC.1